MAELTKILFTSQDNAYNVLKEEIGQCSSYILITDDNTDRLCKSIFLDKLDLKPIAVHSFLTGETNKSLNHVEELIDVMLEHSMDRDSAVVNLGGGIVTDMGGFAASIFKRGIKYFNVPTSLLCMVDASVGGKTGVNHKEIKNQIGSFYHPEISLIDDQYLETLPENEIRSAFAEMLKHGLISSKSHWEDLNHIHSINEVNNWEDLIRQSIDIKKEIVQADPLESKERKLLNFGHSIGHALESLFQGRSFHLSHGHAVALGILVESEISVHYSMLKKEDQDRISEVILRHYDLPDLSKDDLKQLMDFLRFDKKNEDGKYNFTLLEEIGKGKFDCFPDADIIRESLKKCLVTI